MFEGIEVGLNPIYLNAAMTQLEILRKNLLMLRDAYVAATGMSASSISEIIADDRAFYSRVMRTDFRVGSTYDKMVGRYAGVWPKETPWPDGIARPEPVPLTEKASIAFAEYFKAKSEAKEAAIG